MDMNSLINGEFRCIGILPPQHNPSDHRRSLSLLNEFEHAGAWPRAGAGEWWWSFIWSICSARTGQWTGRPVSVDGKLA
jgi:hypothetical protein